MLTRGHWVLLWVAALLNLGVFLARLIEPVPWLGRVQVGTGILMLVACVLAARWYVRHGPGPYRDRPDRL